MSLAKGLRALAAGRQKAVAAQGLMAAGLASPGALAGFGEEEARKLSAVDRCLEILSDSMAKLPNYVIDSRSRRRLADHPALYALNVRPNEAMTPSVRKKALELSRLEGGAGYDWILRDPATGRLRELIPLPWRLVTPWRDRAGRMWYTVTHPLTGEPMVLSGQDVCHYKGSSLDGLRAAGVLDRASEAIAAARAAQQYDLAYYQNGGQPGGILKTSSDLGGYQTGPDGQPLKRMDGSLVSRKDQLREEWERTYAGPKNSHRVAILDLSLDYQPLAASNRDSQFVENKELSVKDICRYFGVPLHFLGEGKMAYNSNEQGAIEYVVRTLHPIVSQYEEEQSYKLLTDSELAAGLEIRINLMAELKGDTNSRAVWYRTMRQEGVFSINDIRALEDMPDIPGGDAHYVPLNYTPLKAKGEEENGQNLENCLGAEGVSG